MSKLASTFAARTAGAADAPAIAAAMASVWMAIDSCLRPVIGANGAAALSMRSLHLTAREHAWLVDLWSEGQRSMDVSRLQSEMSRQSVEEASAAAQCLLQTFHQLVSSLIGGSLAEQLLRRVLEEPWDRAPDEGRAP